MPRFTDKTIEQIKNKITISDLMQNYAFIENRGGSKWVKCPFHGGGNERTASCKIDDARGTFYCFGCHASGDIFSLLMKKEGVDFSTAVEMLAKRANVELEDSSAGNYNKDEARKNREEKESLYDLYNRLSNAFHYMLLNTNMGSNALSYLKKRNVSSEMIETFNLGFAPRDPNWLYSFLREKGYSDAFLANSGLFSQRNAKWPLFSNRLMFPIRDRQGRTIAFSGRDLSGDDKAPKYINSPETKIYQKKENFFGLYEAKNTIAEGKIGPILCEGNFDVVAMHQAGFTSAIASLGTSFTVEQCVNIKKWYPNNKIFNILFDSDEAGQKSTERALMIINQNGFEQRVHKLESAKDSSELLEKGGKEALQKEFNSYVLGFDYLVKTYLNRYDVKNARGKVDFLQSLSPYLAGCKSEVERDSYIITLSSILGVSEETIKEDLNKAKNSTKVFNEERDSNSLDNVKERQITLELYALLYLANHRDLFRTYRFKLSFGDLEDRDAQKIYMAIENAMREGIQSNELFLASLDETGLRDLVATSFALDEYKESRIGTLDEAIDRIKLRSLEKKRNVITNQLRLGSSLDQSEIADLWDRKKDLDRKISLIKENLLNGDAYNNREE